MKNIHLLIFSLSYVIVLQLTSYTNNKTNSKEEKVLEKQLLRAHSISNEITTIRYHPYDKEDLEVSITLLNSILKENKYTLIDDFDRRVKAIFGNIKRYDNIYFLRQDNKCYDSNEILYNDSEGFKLNLYFSIDKKLMIGQYTIPELIDYRTKYPTTSKIEDTISVTKKNRDGENIYVTRWRDISDLDTLNARKTQIGWYIVINTCFMTTELLLIGL